MFKLCSEVNGQPVTSTGWKQRAADRYECFVIIPYMCVYMYLALYYTHNVYMYTVCVPFSLAGNSMP